MIFENAETFSYRLKLPALPSTTRRKIPKQTAFYKQQLKRGYLVRFFLQETVYYDDDARNQTDLAG
jgi:hypothetical protein